MRLIRADSIDALTPVPKEERLHELTDFLSSINAQRGTVCFSIEEICNGEWIIGGKALTTVVGRVPGAGEKAVTRGDSRVAKHSNLQISLPKKT
jgi:hypothetical protein